MITLRDGRRLDFSVAGPEDGYPVLYFHGAIGTALAIGAGVEALGLRYVCVNRPGFGRSDPAPGRAMLDFGDDVEQLADALGLDRFAVVGVSAGGPYALACGCALGERISAIGVVSSHALSARPWGFALADIRTEVHVFHGVKDALVPVDHALQLAANLPRRRAWMDPEEGHFLFRRRLAEVLGAVTGAEARSAPSRRT